MFAIVLFFAVAFAQVTKPTQAQCNFPHAEWTDGECKCNANMLVATGTDPVTFSCGLCSGNTDLYNPETLRCVSECPANYEGSTRTGRNCMKCGEGSMSGKTFYDTHSKQCLEEKCPTSATNNNNVCTCPNGQVTVFENNEYKCKACGEGQVYVIDRQLCETKQTCQPGTYYLNKKNMCECDSSKGFEPTGDGNVEKPCKCTDQNKKIIKETGANNAVTYKCGTCAEGQQYSVQELRCYTPITTCDASKGQVANLDKCVCNGQLNFENKAAAGAALDCQCKADFNLIEKQEGQTKTVTCAKCEGATPKYDKTKKACVKDGVNGLFLILAMTLFFLF